MRQASRYRNVDQRQMALEVICALSGVGAFLVLKHFWLSHLSPVWSEATASALTLLWISRLCRLIYSPVSVVAAAPGKHLSNEAELQLLRTVIDSLPDRIYVKDRQSRFILTNRSLREFSTGSADADVIGKDDFSFFPDPLAARFFKDEQAIMDSGERVGQSGWDMDANGNQVWTLTTKVPYTDKAGCITGLIGIGRDLTAQKRLEESLVQAHEEMRYKATHDALTSLLNRGMILDLLKRELRRTRRECGSTALIIADVDNFKMVNDTLGHMVGDEVLREVARRLTESVRSYDFVGRYGGEEFLLVLSNCENCSPLDRAEQIRESICRSPIPSSRGDLHITISIGVLSSSEWSSMSAEEMLRQADAALYAAKGAGRNCCHLISSKSTGELAITRGSGRSKVCDASCRTAARSKQNITLNT